MRGLEERDVRRVSTIYSTRRIYSELHQELESLGVRQASCFRMPGTGRVHWTMGGSGGIVVTVGSALPQWVEEFLRDPEREDVLFKLL